MNKTPRLSIGLPVFNGERHLAAALGSLLDQSFADFELIVCDNASTDATAEICEAFAAADARIRYQRQPRNLGAAANYNRCVALARGEYFKWAAHDDVCLPGFLERCVALLDAEPWSVLAHCHSLAIDEGGRVIGRYDGEVEATDARPSARFWRMISTPHYCIPVFGVMRLTVLRATPMHGEYVGADRNLLAELALHGQIRLVSEPLFQRRHHAGSSITKFRDERERIAWFNPALAGQGGRPTWRRWREYRASIARVPLPFSERLAAHAALLRWMGACHHTGPRNAALLWRELRGQR